MLLWYNLGVLNESSPTEDISSSSLQKKLQFKTVTIPTKPTHQYVNYAQKWLLQDNFKKNVL